MAVVTVAIVASPYLHRSDATEDNTMITQQEVEALTAKMLQKVDIEYRISLTYYKMLLCVTDARKLWEEQISNSRREGDAIAVATIACKLYDARFPAEPLSTRD